MFGNLIISSQQVTYNNSIDHKINIEKPRRLTDTKRLHLKMPIFLKRATKEQEIISKIEEVIRVTRKVEGRNWKTKIQEVFPKKFCDIQKAAQRVYKLYTYRGLSNLFGAQTITSYVLMRIYNKDFDQLILEAQTQKSQEEAKLINLYDTFAGAQEQE
ncbi:5056_t:CDS:2, partial [Dentiscutata heterogama]